MQISSTLIILILYTFEVLTADINESSCFMTNCVTCKQKPFATTSVDNCEKCSDGFNLVNSPYFGMDRNTCSGESINDSNFGMYAAIAAAGLLGLAGLGLGGYILGNALGLFGGGGGNHSNPPIVSGLNDLGDHHPHFPGYGNEQYYGSPVLRDPHLPNPGSRFPPIGEIKPIGQRLPGYLGGAMRSKIPTNNLVSTFGPDIPKDFSSSYLPTTERALRSPINSPTNSVGYFNAQTPPMKRRIIRLEGPQPNMSQAPVQQLGSRIVRCPGQEIPARIIQSPSVGDLDRRTIAQLGEESSIIRRPPLCNELSRISQTQRPILLREVEPSVRYRTVNRVQSPLGSILVRSVGSQNSGNTFYGTPERKILTSPQVIRTPQPKRFVQAVDSQRFEKISQTADFKRVHNPRIVKVSSMQKKNLFPVGQSSNSYTDELNNGWVRITGDPSERIEKLTFSPNYAESMQIGLQNNNLPFKSKNVHPLSMSESVVLDDELNIPSNTGASHFERVSFLPGNEIQHHVKFDDSLKDSHIREIRGKENDINSSNFMISKSPSQPSKWIRKDKRGGRKIEKNGNVRIMQSSMVSPDQIVSPRSGGSSFDDRGLYLPPIVSDRNNEVKSPGESFRATFEKGLYNQERPRILNTGVARKMFANRPGVDSNLFNEKQNRLKNFNSLETKPSKQHLEKKRFQIQDSSSIFASKLSSESRPRVDEVFDFRDNGDSVNESDQLRNRPGRDRYNFYCQQLPMINSDNEEGEGTYVRMIPEKKAEHQPNNKNEDHQPRISFSRQYGQVRFVS